MQLSTSCLDRGAGGCPQDQDRSTSARCSRYRYSRYWCSRYCPAACRLGVALSAADETLEQGSRAGINSWRPCVKGSTPGGTPGINSWRPCVRFSIPRRHAGRIRAASVCVPVGTHCLGQPILTARVARTLALTHDFACHIWSGVAAAGCTQICPQGCLHACAHAP
jgi:hypothetical protein